VAINLVGAEFKVVVAPVSIHGLTTPPQSVIVIPFKVILVLAVNVVKVPAAGVLPPITAPSIVPLFISLSVTEPTLPDCVTVEPAKFIEFTIPTGTPSS
jgi:hypothetical protein